MAALLPSEEGYEMAIPSYLHRNPALRWMAWRRVELLAESLQSICLSAFPDAAPKIMDFGCGTGVLFETAERVAERIYGVDRVLGAADLLIDEWNLEKVTLLTPEEAIQVVPKEGLDIVVAGEVLEHLDSLSDTLAFFRSSLGRAGRLLVSLPTEGLLYRVGRSLAGFHGEYHRSHAAAIDKEIVRADFRRVRIKKIPGPSALAIYWIVEYRLA